jgi:hypothetical protein
MRCLALRAVQRDTVQLDDGTNRVLDRLPSCLHPPIGAVDTYGLELEVVGSAHRLRRCDGGSQTLPALECE